MKTKQEIVNFLESKVGTKVKCVGNPSLDGQCVTLIKSLMDFLGVRDPYKARGHAKTCISAYLNEGIAKKGAGFISVFSNKEMGDEYGHIWLNAGDGDGIFYESNGQKPLIVTKDKTYSYDMVCNFDEYIKSDSSEPESTNMTGDQFYTKFLEAFRKHKNDVEWGDDKFKFEADGLKDEAMIGRMIDNIALYGKPKTITEIKEVIKEVKVEVPVEKIVYKDNPNLKDWEANGLVTEQEIDGIKYITNHKKKA